MLGSRRFASVTSTRVLSSSTTASVTMSYSPDAGAGCIVSSSRAMSTSCTGEFSLVVGPAPACNLSVAKVRAAGSAAGTVQTTPTLTRFPTRRRLASGSRCLASWTWPSRVQTGPFRPSTS